MDCNIYRTPVQNFWLRGWFKKSFIKHSIRKPKVHLSSTYCYRLIMQCARRNNFQCWSTIYNMASKKLHFEWWKIWNIASTSYWIHQSIKCLDMFMFIQVYISGLRLNVVSLNFYEWKWIQHEILLPFVFLLVSHRFLCPLHVRSNSINRFTISLRKSH